MTKRYLTLALTIFLCLSLFSACGKNDDETLAASMHQPTLPGDMQIIIQGGNGSIGIVGPSKPSFIPNEDVRPSQSTQSTQPTTVDPSTCAHRFELELDQEATCMEQGRRIFCCTLCQTVEEEFYPLADHVLTYPTCLSPATCVVCEQSFGDYGEHAWAGGYPCLGGSTCVYCGDVKTADHQFNGIYCIVCCTPDPDYGNDSGSTDDPDPVPDTSDVNVKYNLTSFPVSVPYGTVTGCTHEISGDTLILYVSMKRNSSSGNKSMECMYRINNGVLKEVAKASFSSPSIGPGESCTVTVTIPGIIKSSGGPYSVYISQYIY